MVRKLILAIAILFLTAPAADAGTIIRGDKATGGTAFVSGVILPAEVNYDFDTLYTEFNGEIDNDNIASDAAISITKLTLTNAITDAMIYSAANISYSKMLQTAAMQDMDIVDDFSATEDEQDDTINPGTSGSATETSNIATNLEEEIAQLRYKIHQLTLGTSSGPTAASGETHATSTWIDGPYRPGNHIYNGGFDVLHTLATGFDGDGWVRVLTPTTLQAIALTPSDGYGEGDAIEIIDTDEALSGIKQTLTSLKADTKYLLTGRVRDSVGTCRLVTTGADTNQLTITSDDSNTWQILSGTFETDSTPAAVVVQLLAVAPFDDCIFEDIGVFEINSDPVVRTGKVHCYDSTTTPVDGLFTDGVFVNSGLSCAVTPPGPGYIITVRARLSADNDAAADREIEGKLVQTCSGATDVDWATAHARQNNNTTVDDMATLEFYYVNDSPTPGQVCTYTMLAAAHGATSWDLLEETTGNDGASNVVGTPIAYIDVMMEPI